MSRGKMWLAASAALAIAAVSAAPIFHKAFQLALARSAGTSAPAQAVPGDPEQPIEARGSQPKQPPVFLTISGEILGLAPGAAPSSILVRVGNRSFAGQIQGGGYVATVDALDFSEMVSVEVASQRVRYRSVVGSFGKLAQRSGGDRRVDDAELQTLRVSPLSSALAFLVRNALDGRDAISDREFERISRSLFSEDVFEARALLDSVASGAVVLPEGYADGQQLLENEAAYNQWILSFNGRSGSDEAMFQQIGHAPLSSLSELPEQTLLMATIQRDSYPVFANPPQLLLRDADGSYRWYTGDTEEAPVNYRAQLDASGDVLLSPLAPRVFERFEGVDRRRFSLDRVVLRRLFDGDRHDMWVVREQWSRTSVAQPAMTLAPDIEIRLWSASDLQQVARTRAWTSAPTRRALPWPCSKSNAFFSSHQRLETCDFVQHRFDPGGSGVTQDHGAKIDSYMRPQAAGAGVAFEWTVEGDQLVVRTPLATLRYWSIDGDDDTVDTVIYLATGNSGATAGQTWTGVSGSLAIDSVPFEAAQAVGTWTPASARTAETMYPNPHYTLEVQRDAGGYAEQREDGYGSGPRSATLRWETVDGRVYETLTTAVFDRREGQRNVRDCATAFAAGALTCAPSRVRYFRPLKRVGDGLYGIEELHYQFEQKPPGYTGPYDVVTADVRPNYYRCTAGVCLTPPAPPTARLPAIRTPKPVPTPSEVDSSVKIPMLSVVRPRTSRIAMPIYAFQCSACGHSFDRLQKLSDADPSVCPSCGAEAVSRQLTAPQFRLAGGGWYETDFKKDGDKKRNLADAGGSGSSSGSDAAKPAAPAETKAASAKSESKPAAKPASSAD